jgi:hypothetical protein
MTGLIEARCRARGESVPCHDAARQQPGWRDFPPGRLINRRCVSFRGVFRQHPPLQRVVLSVIQGARNGESNIELVASCGWPLAATARAFGGTALARAGRPAPRTASVRPVAAAPEETVATPVASRIVGLPRTRKRVQAAKIQCDSARIEGIGRRPLSALMDAVLSTVWPFRAPLGSARVPGEGLRRFEVCAFVAAQSRCTGILVNQHERARCWSVRQSQAWGEQGCKAVRRPRSRSEVDAGRGLGQ